MTTPQPLVSTTASESPGTPPESLSEVEVARKARSAVRQVAGVAEIASGHFVEAATYGPGETVHRVVVRAADEGLLAEVHVTAAYSDQLVLPELADRIREAIREAVGLNELTVIRRIDVVFEDLRMGR